MALIVREPSRNCLQDWDDDSIKKKKKKKNHDKISLQVTAYLQTVESMEFLILILIHLTCRLCIVNGCL